METFSSWIVTVQLAYLKLYSGKKRNILYIIYMKVLVKSIIYIAPVLYSLISSFKKKYVKLLVLFMTTIILLQTTNQKIYMKAFSQNACNSFTTLVLYKIFLVRKCLVGCFEGKKKNP